jgi:hypothetical protein
MELEETALGIYDYLLGRLALEFYSDNSEDKLKRYGLVVINGNKLE